MLSALQSNRVGMTQKLQEKLVLPVLSVKHLKLYFYTLAKQLLCVISFIAVYHVVSPAVEQSRNDSKAARKTCINSPECKTPKTLFLYTG